MSRLQQILSATIAVGSCDENVPRASVEIEGGNVGRGLAFDGRFFGRRHLGMKVLSYVFGDLTLNSKYLVQIAIVLLGPNMTVGARVD